MKPTGYSVAGGRQQLPGGGHDMAYGGADEVAGGGGHGLAHGGAVGHGAAHAAAAAAAAAGGGGDGAGELRRGDEGLMQYGRGHAALAPPDGDLRGRVLGRRRETIIIFHQFSYAIQKHVSCDSPIE